MKVFALVVGWIGAFLMFIAGGNMMRIQSESAAEGGSPSIMEIFYHDLGLGFIGLGLFCIVLICVVVLKGVRFTEETKQEDFKEGHSEDDD